MPPLSTDKPEYFLNREVSWLRFNQRVLEEADEENNPLLERVKFLSITASNLDEFFEVRLAGLLQRIEDGYTTPGPDGLPPEQELESVIKQTTEFVDAQYSSWNDRLRPALSENGIRILELNELDTNAADFLNDYCEREVDPLLTPITIDPAHPFPRVVNKALCLAFLLRRRRRSSAVYMGVITVPRSLPRILRVPSSEGTHDHVFLADLVASHAAKMYRGYEIVSAAAFRVTRNSNLYLQEEESRNLLESVRTELHNRRKGDAVRLEIEAAAAPEIVERLRGNFGLDEWQVFRTNGPVNLSRVSSIYEQTQRSDLKFKPFVPRELHLTGKSRDIFEEIRKHDILLHHPFDSFNAVVGFIEVGAKDPKVISMRQTLYRTGEESPIVQAMSEAAATKEVTVVVELKARFDEASNIRWARSLEEAGVQVFHGLVGLKTHCKLTLLARQDSDGEIRQYAHLGTCNYNPSTAHFYSDLSLLTCEPELTSAVHAVFNFLTARSEASNYKPLFISPIDLAKNCIALIDRETIHARRKRPARIIAKVNALLDQPLIEALYRASRAGVEIDLIIRGACALRPNVNGLSHRIRVRSIVGRFLEHSR